MDIVSYETVEQEHFSFQDNIPYVYVVIFCRKFINLLLITLYSIAEDIRGGEAVRRVCDWPRTVNIKPKL